MSLAFQTRFVSGQLPARSISLWGELEDREFKELIRIAKSNTEVSDTLSKFDSTDNRFVNYVIPNDLLISEAPIHIPEDRTPSHRQPYFEDQSRYKIIFTTVQFGPSATADGTEILRRAIIRSPILEVWIDRTTGRVE